MTQVQHPTRQDRAEPVQSAAGPAPLPPAVLRWRCDPDLLGFESTADVEPASGVVGQDAAMEALNFGLRTRAVGQNVFIRGLTGTGRMTLIRRMLKDMNPVCPDRSDRCYVHNFAQPDRPRLITLPRGKGRRFKHVIEELADFIRDDLGQALGAEPVRERKAAIDEAAKEEVKAIVEPFEKSLEQAGLALVAMPVGPIAHSAVLPIVDGKPVTPQEFEWLHQQGKVSDEQFAQSEERREAFEKQLEDINRQVHDIRRKHSETVQPFFRDEARSILRVFVNPIAAEFTQPGVKRFLDEIVEDVVERRLHGLEAEEGDFTRIYRVNVVLVSPEDDACPIIVETLPTMAGLLGLVDHEVGPGGMVRSDHHMIRAGSLLRADGGYLILEARDVVGEPGAWKTLTRTLRTGRLEIVPPEISMPWWSPSLKPEPIDIKVKVVLLGDASMYALLDAMDPDFPHLFKVLVDFDSVIPREDKSLHAYAGVLARITKEENLSPLDKTAVAALIEHGARIGARSEKLTARFGRLADVVREADWIAGTNDHRTVTGDDVREAIRRTKQRAGLPSRSFRELLAKGTIRVETSGATVGQVNGLAVVQTGPLTSGFPARITATIGPGTAGVINIEREAALSGAIHTKGFYILGGLLRYLLQTDHPLAFDASVAFEQTYGGIDGDSASGAEICCLLSALTGMPIRQDLAMTGAIDQFGHILAVGAVNEKIEGFFDTCRDIGLTSKQGVIIPGCNTGDLMLRHDVVEACSAGRFHVYAVDTVHEALHLLTGIPAGDRNRHGEYPDGTLLHRAVQRASEYWLKAAKPSPAAQRTAAEQETATVQGDGAAANRTE